MGRIEIHGVRYRYPNAVSDTLHDISFHLEPSQTILVFGPNLSGKTTLATIILRHHLCQLEGILSGTIDLSFDHSPNKLVGFTFEDPNWMFCNLQVEDEVAFGLENMGVSPESIRHRVDEGLERVGLSGFQSRQINTLSGGEIQKLAIAAALVTDPQIIITDDLLSNLDVASAPLLSMLVDSSRSSSGCAWIDLTRQWRDDWRCSNQLAIINQGSFLDVGKTAEVLLAHQSAPGEHPKFELPPELELLTASNESLTSQNIAAIPFTLDRNRIIEEVSRRFVPESSGSTSVIARSKGLTDSGNVGLSLRNVGFRYPNGAFALKDCSLEFAPSCINVLAGRNGSGKSTLAKIAAGLLKSDAGRIFWAGQAVNVRFLRERVGMVFQNPEYHFLTDSVLDEIRLSGDLLSIDAGTLGDEIEKLIFTLGFESKLEASPFGLTVGEKRRLAVALALMRRPDVLVVDEPTLGQDYGQSCLLGSMFLKMRSEGTTVILISHDARFIFEYGEAIHLLDSGVVTYSGSVPPLFSPNAKTDFADKSHVLSLWMQLTEDAQVDEAPRSIAELFARLRPVIHGN
jgi:energy-coupling factor transport system ATP-binding protein